MLPLVVLITLDDVFHPVYSILTQSKYRNIVIMGTFVKHWAHISTF